MDIQNADWRSFLFAFGAYLLNIIHVGVYALAVTCPILLFSVSDVAEGVSEGNISFFLVYNSLISVYWSLASWKRLQKLCRRTKSIDGRDAFSILRVSANNTKVLAALVFVYVLAAACITVVALPWGSNLGRSYNMMYFAPVVLTTYDLLFFFIFLPESEKTFAALRMIFVYSNICSVPIILLFIPVVVKIMFESVWVELALPLLIFPLMKTGLGRIAEKVMKHELNNCGYDTELGASGFELHLELIFQMGLVMLFPGEEEPFVLYAILIQDVAIAAWTMWRLSHSNLDSEATTNKLARFHVEFDVPLVLAPLIFVVMFTIIFFGWNTAHYHV